MWSLLRHFPPPSPPEALRAAVPSPGKVYLTGTLKWKSGGGDRGQHWGGKVNSLDRHPQVGEPGVHLCESQECLFTLYSHSCYLFSKLCVAFHWAAKSSWWGSPKELASSLRCQSNCLKKWKGFLLLETWNTLSKPGARIKTIWFALQKRSQSLKC